MNRDQTNLFLSCQMGDIKGITDALTKNPSLVNICDQRQSWSPLFRVVSSGNLQAVRYLLSQGAKIDLQSKTGETALHQAVDLGYHEIAQLLLTLKSDPNTQQIDGETPLHLAAFKGDCKMILLLLEFDANPNLQTVKSKRSPLHYAVDCNYIESAVALISEGGDIYLRDKDGISPLDLAASLEMEALLKNVCKSSSVCSSFVNPFDEPAGTGEGTTYLISDLGDEKSSLGETHPQQTRFSSKPSPELKEIFLWLESIKLEHYYETLIDAGYDNSLAMVQQMKGPLPITELDLATIGISKPGHRKRILWKLEQESADKHRRKKSVGMFKCCGQIRDGTGAVISVPSLQSVLSDLSMHEAIYEFVESGYDSYEILIAQSSSKYGLNKEILFQEVGLSDLRVVRKFLSRLASDVIVYKLQEIVFEEGKMGSCELCVIL